MHSAKNKELRENVIDRARTMYAMLCIRLVEIFSERLYILRCAAILNNDVAIKHRFSQTMSFLTSASSLSQLYAVYIRETATIITTQISRCYAAEPEEPLWCVIKQSSKRERKECYFRRAQAHSSRLLLARTRIDGDWSTYIGI